VLREYFELNGSWSWVKDHVWAGGELIATVEPTGTKHLHRNHLGSVRVETSGTGAVVATHSYWPFGEEMTVTSSSERYRFAGHELDQRTGYDYTHARYYAPMAGWFFSVDPGRDYDFSHPQSFNLYAYVRNNPVNAVDPTGRYSWARSTSSLSSTETYGGWESVLGFGDTLFFRTMPQEAPGGGGGAAAQANQAEDQARVDALVQAQDDVRTRFAPIGSTTFCNRATVETARRLGANVTDMVDAQGRPLLANDIAANLAQSTNWRRVTPEEAKQLANRGVVVIATQRRPDGHGHVATVRPAQAAQGVRPGSGPFINNVGTQRYTGVFHQSTVFRRDTPVLYYAPAGGNP
jgi:RHS repeat-associated protein